IGRLILPRVPRFSLFPLVQLIRPSMSLVTVPTGRGRGTRTELGDMQLFDLAVLPWPSRETGIYMGVGGAGRVAGRSRVRGDLQEDSRAPARHPRAEPDLVRVHLARPPAGAHAPGPADRRAAPLARPLREVGGRDVVVRVARGFADDHSAEPRARLGGAARELAAAQPVRRGGGGGAPPEHAGRAP